MKSNLDPNFLPTSPGLRVEVLVQRKAEKSVLARSQRQGYKKRDIYAKYPDKVKADALIQRLRSRGLWYWDPDFDKDEEARFAICFSSIRNSSRHFRFAKFQEIHPYGLFSFWGLFFSSNGSNSLGDLLLPQRWQCDEKR